MVFAVGLLSSLLLYSLFIPESVPVKILANRTNLVLRKNMAAVMRLSVPAHVRFSITLELEARGDNSVDSKLKDGVVPEIGLDLENHSELGSEPNDNNTDCEMEDGVLNDFDEDLWNLLNDFSEALYKVMQGRSPSLVYA